MISKQDRRQKATIEDVYGGWGCTFEEVEAQLDESLNPRPPAMLFDKIGELGLSSKHRVLDVGCRFGEQACEIASRYGCEVIGIDPVAANIDEGHKIVAEKGMESQVKLALGDIQSIEHLDESFDYVWSRDMLNHVPDLSLGMSECARVLKPGGQMLIFVTLATELLEPSEAKRLYDALAVVPENMSASYIEDCFKRAGFEIVERDVIGSEWREWREEQEGESSRTSRQLLHIARLRRKREEYLARFGRAVYGSVLANAHWSVYLILGKLESVIYVLKK